MIWPNLFPYLSPQASSNDSRDDEEVRDSKPSSPSLSLSSMENDQSPFNVTHIYKMARRHSMDTTAVLHELKPGSTRRETKML